MKKSNLILIAAIVLIIYYLTRPLNRVSDENEAHIQKMDASIRNNVRAFLKEVEALGYTPKIIDSTRTYQQQAYYKKLDKRNASAGHSSHETGNAFDIKIYKGKQVLTKGTPKNIWTASGIPEIAKYYGMRWGGNFKGYPDNNHFDFLKL
jgi:D-alanyl-D-alanine dipeptidase